MCFFSEVSSSLCSGTLSNLRYSIFCYAAKIPASRHSLPLLTSQLENFLERVRLKNPGSKLSKEPTLLCSVDSSWVPWDDVVLIFMDHKLKDWQLPGPPVCRGLHHLNNQHILILPSVINASVLIFPFNNFYFCPGFKML